MKLGRRDASFDGIGLNFAHEALRQSAGLVQGPIQVEDTGIEGLYGAESARMPGIPRALRADGKRSYD
jgi:hypothetical protein